MNNTSLKLRDKPVGRLLFTMSFPAIISMLVQALYNIVDSIFVSHISDDALNAVTLAFPLQIFIFAFALGVGIGTGSLISRKKGERKDHEAEQIAKTGIVLALIIGTIFLIFGTTIIKPILSVMTDNDNVLVLSNQYLSIVVSLSIFVMLEITLRKILQSVGNMFIPMLCQILGATINILLDYIFIFVFNWGVPGAAIATVTSQFIAFAIVLSSFVFKKQEINISLKNFRFKKQNVIDISKVGFPVMIMNSLTSLTISTLLYLLSYFHNDETLEQAAQISLGIYFRLQSFVFMPIYGLNQGGMPIIAYNYGANQRQRFDRTIRLALITGLTIATCGFLAFQLFPELLLSMFNPTKETMDIGPSAFRILSLAFIPAVFIIIYSMVFQALGHGFKSLIMTIFRQYVFLIPIAYIIGILGHVNLIYLSFFIAETLTIIIFIPIAVYTIKKQFMLKDQYNFT